MDGDDRRASQYGQPYHHTHSGSRLPPTSQPSMGPPNTADRFGQPGTPVRSDSVRHSMTRSYLPGYSQYGYHEQPQYGGNPMHDNSPMQGVEMQYSPTAAYMQNAAARQAVGQGPAAHQYGGYQQSPMLSSNAQQAMYDSLPPYQQQQSRQSAAIEVMSSQLGAISGHYDPQSGLQMPASASSYAQQQQQPQQQQPHPHFSSTPHGSQSYTSSSSPYPSLHETIPSQHLPGQQQQGHPTAQQSQSQTPVQAQPSAAEAEAIAVGFRDFHNSLNTALQLIISTSTSQSSSTTANNNTATTLHTASKSLLTITRWLVANIQSLGLHHDTDSAQKHVERSAMWTRLNLAWEGLAEALRSLCAAVLTASRVSGRGRRSGAGAGLGDITSETIRNLISSVVDIGNDLEGFGLVDYELGFAEELIVAGLLGVLHLVEEIEGEGNDEAPGSGAATKQSRISASTGIGLAGGGGGGSATARGRSRGSDIAMSGLAGPSAVGMARSGI